MFEFETPSFIKINISGLDRLEKNGISVEKQLRNSGNAKPPHTFLSAALPCDLLPNLICRAGVTFSHDKSERKSVNGLSNLRKFAKGSTETFPSSIASAFANRALC